MKKRNSKLRLLRPADGFLPGALLICSLLGKSDMADNLFQCLLFSRLFALASAIGLRQAFSRQPSMRMARGSVKAALLLQPVGAALTLGLSLLSDGGRIAPSMLVCLVAGLLLNIEHVFYEYLAAAGEGNSAALSRAVTAALTAGGLMLTSAGAAGGLLPYRLEWLLGAAALSTAAAAVIALGIGGRLKGRINGEVLRCAPAAMLQCFAYPLAWAAILLIPGNPAAAARTSAPFFAGLMLCELCRTPFRRSAAESRPMNRVLAVIAAVCVIVIGLWFVPAAHDALVNIMKNRAADVPGTAVMVLTSAVCSFGMFGRISAGAP